MPRFVILQHEPAKFSPRLLHWDLMLEQGDALRTWALEQAPTTKGEINARRLADHRLAYLIYEGPVSGNRGAVFRWDQGEYEITYESEHEIAFEIRGEKLNGAALLSRLTADPEIWRFELL
jgi:hypothetical protein